MLWRLIAIFFGTIVLCLNAAASGTVTGTVTDPTGAVMVSARVSLSSGGDNSQQNTYTDQNGRFKLTNLPLGRIVLHVNAPGFAPVEAAVDVVNSTAPVLVNIHFKSVTEAQQINVLEGTADAGPTVTHHDITEEDFEKMPVPPASKAVSTLLESIPGVVPEENGRIHVRGSEVQPEYVMDGVPLDDNLNGTYATSLDIENLNSMRVITGNIPAEFGGRSSSIVNLASKSGLQQPWSGSFSFSGGSFDTGAIDTEIAGSFKQVGVFLTADTLRSRRYLDPPEIQNFHNRGGLAHLFARFDLLATAKDNVRLTFATNGTDLQVPNSFEQQFEGQRQRQELRDDSQTIDWTHAFNGTTLSDITFFRRSSTARLLDPNITGAPFFIEQNRRQRTEALRASFSKDWKWNSFKAGIEAHRLPVRETFVLAPRDTVDIASESPILAYSTDQPFQFLDRRTGSIQAAYVQDRIRVQENLTIDLGLRYDRYQLLIHDDAFSPRIGVAYHISGTNTILRASYNRIFQAPPLENILLSSSAAAATLSSANADSFSPVPAERQNMYELGFQQQFGRYVRLDFAHYVKNIRNFSDDQQLFATPIIFPVAITAADIRGSEVRLDLMQLQGWTAYVSYADARATATSPIVGGLLLGHIGSDGGQFPADQDERNEAQFGATYTHRSGPWFNFTGRYDSGIPTDFEPGDFAGFDPNIQQQLSLGHKRIRPRTLLSTAAGIELLRESRFPVTLQVSVNNLTNRFYLYNFQSVFSGTHIGRPREVVGRVTLHWRSEKK